MANRTRKIVLALRSFGGPWTIPNNKKDEIHVGRGYIWIGTRRGGMSIHGRKTMLALADAIYTACGERAQDG